MVLLKPNGKIDLEHRVWFLRGAPQQAVVIAAGDDGHYSVLSSDFREVRSHFHSTTLRATSLHPTSPWLAMVDKGSGSLVVQTIDGGQLVDISPPEVPVAEPDWIEPGFEDCRFDESGEFLWLAATRSVEEHEVSLIETANWSVVDRIIVNDPFGGGSCSFHETGRTGLTAL